MTGNALPATSASHHSASATPISSGVMDDVSITVIAQRRAMSLTESTVPASRPASSMLHRPRDVLQGRSRSGASVGEAEVGLASTRIGSFRSSSRAFCTSGLTSSRQTAMSMRSADGAASASPAGIGSPLTSRCFPPPRARCATDRLLDHLVRQRTVGTSGSGRSARTRPARCPVRAMARLESGGVFPAPDAPETTRTTFSFLVLSSATDGWKSSGEREDENIVGQGSKPAQSVPATRARARTPRPARGRGGRACGGSRRRATSPSTRS